MQTDIVNAKAALDAALKDKVRFATAFVITEYGFLRGLINDLSVRGTKEDQLFCSSLKVSMFSPTHGSQDLRKKMDIYVRNGRRAPDKRKIDACTDKVHSNNVFFTNLASVFYSEAGPFGKEVNLLNRVPTRNGEKPYITTRNQVLSDIIAVSMICERRPELQQQMVDAVSAENLEGIITGQQENRTSHVITPALRDSFAQVYETMSEDIRQIRDQILRQFDELYPCVVKNGPELKTSVLNVVPTKPIVPNGKHLANGNSPVKVEITSATQVLDLIRGKNKAVAESVTIIEFKQGRLEIQVNNRASSEVVGKVAHYLFEATGKRWSVVIKGSEKSRPTENLPYSALVKQIAGVFAEAKDKTVAILSGGSPVVLPKAGCWAYYAQHRAGILNAVQNAQLSAASLAELSIIADYAFADKPILLQGELKAAFIGQCLLAKDISTSHSLGAALEQDRISFFKGTFGLGEKKHALANQLGSYDAEILRYSGIILLSAEFTGVARELGQLIKQVATYELHPGPRWAKITTFNEKAQQPNNFPFGLPDYSQYSQMGFGRTKAPLVGKI